MHALSYSTAHLCIDEGAYVRISENESVQGFF